MKTVCMNGYKYLDLGDDKLALVIGVDGLPEREDVNETRWVRHQNGDYELVQGVRH